MALWSPEHRAFAVETFFKNSDSFAKTQRLFRTHFNVGRHGAVPDRKTIGNWVTLFRNTASTQKRIGGSRKTVRTPANVERVRVAVTRSRKRSARKQVLSLQISNRSVRRILHQDLHFHPYKIQVVQELKEPDYNRRVMFCDEILTVKNQVPNLSNLLIMSDEAHFYLSGHVNKHNMRYWSADNPKELHPKPLHSPKVTVWCAVSTERIFGPYFFEDNGGNTVTVTSDRYVDMLNNFFIPLLEELEIDTEQLYFQQDGATAHTADQSMTALRNVFENHLISRFGDISWPARSPDLSVCDFFLWGYLKFKVFQSRPRDLLELKQRIAEEVQAIPQGMLERVFDAFFKRLEECQCVQGRHLKDVVFKK